MRKIYFKFYQETYKSLSLLSTASRRRPDRRHRRKHKESLGFKCEGCLDGHLRKALKCGATPEEISETISIAMGVAAASVVDQTDHAAERLQVKHFD